MDLFNLVIAINFIPYLVLSLIYWIMMLWTGVFVAIISVFLGFFKILLPLVLGPLGCILAIMAK